MPLLIIKSDITKVRCDAIVNAANKTLLGGAGVDGAIHKAAGRGLLAECRTLGGCRTGEAKITKGYDLPAKYVIHTVGPVWTDGRHGEEELLRSCYRNCLAVAKEHDAESIAFPLISSGVYGYPREQALKIAVDEIAAFLRNEEMLVYLVIYGGSSFRIDPELYKDIASFIDDNYTGPEDRHPFRENAGRPRANAKACRFPEAHGAAVADEIPHADNHARPELCVNEAIHTQTAAVFAGRQSLDDALKQIDESFSEMLLRKIDEKGITDAECYKKANVDRKLFSKIRSDRLYRPSKATAIAFAIALELPLDETRDMLMKAGFALSRSNKFDIIIEYFITNGNYDVFEINEALFAFDQVLLGV